MTAGLSDDTVVQRSLRFSGGAADEMYEGGVLFACSDGNHVREGR